MRGIQMTKSIMTTKKDANTLVEVLTAFGIESNVTISGTRWCVEFDFDSAQIKHENRKKSNAGRKPKCELTGIKMQKELMKIGMAGVCEKYGITERTVYRKLNEK